VALIDPSSLEEAFVPEKDRSVECAGLLLVAGHRAAPRSTDAIASLFVISNLIALKDSDAYTEVISAPD